ncbi:MAG: LCP family protein [Oscillospiraceae bacterium]|nr:LCP family protein [Oscillospiraceae bacterium]
MSLNAIEQSLDAICERADRWEAIRYRVIHRAVCARPRKAARRRSPAARVGAVAAALMMIALSAGLWYFADILLNLKIVPPDIPPAAYIDPEDIVASEGEQPIVKPPPVTGVQVRGNVSGITNILLIGVDTRSPDSFSGLSDTMLIMSVNEHLKEIRFISLLRDTAVDIPKSGGGHSYAKLNAAYAAGGAELLKQTVKHNFCLDIDEYIVVNFSGFEKVIDAVGGLEIDLTKAELTQIPKSKNDDAKLSGEARTVHLTGYQALQYARIRKIDASSDFARTLRQQKVLTLLLDKAKESALPQLLSLVQETAPYVMTNIQLKDLLSYVKKGYNHWSGYEIVTGYRVPGLESNEFTDLYIQGGQLALILTDPTRTVLALHQYLYDGGE